MSDLFVYLDHNASTPLHPKVVEALSKHMDLYGNPSGIHQIAQKARGAYEAARDQLAQFLGIDPYKIIFTSSATEANNQVLASVLAHHRQSPCHVIVSAIEHSSVRNMVKVLEANGVSVSIAPVREDCRISPEVIAELITPETCLVSVMGANNETGTLQPIQAISDLCQSKGIRFHTDAVQMLGKVDFDLNVIKPTYVSLSAHKCYGPKGIGALISFDDEWLHPLLVGGEHERKLRAGTENVLGAIGFGAVCEVLAQSQETLISHYQTCRDHFLSALSQTDLQYELNGHGTEVTPNTVNLSLLGHQGTSAAMQLDLAGYGVSTGSACATGSIEPSPILLAMGLSDDRVNSAIRISFGKDTTTSDINGFIDALTNLKF